MPRLSDGADEHETRHRETPRARRAPPPPPRLVMLPRPHNGGHRYAPRHGTCTAGAEVRMLCSITRREYSRDEVAVHGCAHFVALHVPCERIRDDMTLPGTGASRGAARHCTRDEMKLLHWSAVCRAACSKRGAIGTFGCNALRCTSMYVRRNGVASLERIASRCMSLHSRCHGSLYGASFRRAARTDPPDPLSGRCRGFVATFTQPRGHFYPVATFTQVSPLTFTRGPLSMSPRTAATALP